MTEWKDQKADQKRIGDGPGNAGRVQAFSRERSLNIDALRGSGTGGAALPRRGICMGLSPGFLVFYPGHNTAGKHPDQYFRPDLILILEQSKRSRKRLLFHIEHLSSAASAKHTRISIEIKND
jgi:hypothetical protein